MNRTRLWMKEKPAEVDEEEVAEAETTVQLKI